MKTFKTISKLMAIIGMCSLLVACSSGGGGSYASYNSSSRHEYTAESENQDVGYDKSANSNPGQETSRKQTKNYYIEADTEHFDSLKDKVTGLIAKYKGYVDNANYHNEDHQSVSMDIFLPAQDADKFIKDLEEDDNFNLLSKQESLQDVEDDYTDIETRLEALNKKLDKLYELQKGQKDVNLILDLDSRINDTIEQIEVLKGNKKGLDNDVKYSNIHLNLTEITTISNNKGTEPTFSKELSGVVHGTYALYQSLVKNLVFIIVFLSPVIIVITLLNIFVFKKKISLKSLFYKGHKTKKD